MFSGIRYIFGYTDDESSCEAATDALSGNPSVQPKEAETLVSASTAALEKTLNAATTKFTEQLLPQQASIEQLQSSSHQLLPSIKEQHEENESKKQASVDEATEAIELEASGFATVDDDDCLEADSWELLDLVEKVENHSKVSSGSASMNVGKDGSSPFGLNKSTSGILKSTSSSSVGNSVGQQPARQKPKVSFETPDLVSSKQEIEENKPKEANASSVPKKSKRSKRNAKITGSADAGQRRDESQQDGLVVNKVAVASTRKSGQVPKSGKKKPCGANPSVNLGTIMKAEVTTPCVPLVPAPTLNYAKALSTKQVEVAKKVDTVAAKIEKPLTMEATIGGENEEKLDPCPQNLKSLGPQAQGDISKPNRNAKVEQIEGGLVRECDFPELSCSQLPGESSNGASCKSFQCNKTDGLKNAAENVDAMSMTSSGFSDCDFGFVGMNDYVMRTKKANTKRNRTQSGSSGSFRAPKVGRGHSTKHAGANNRQPTVASNEDSKNLPGKPTVVAKVNSSAQVTANKNSKPKRKRLTSTTGLSNAIAEPSSVDFLKPTVQAKRKLKGQAENNLAVKQSPVSSSNDSSEIPEMDESWYVTPPPCFTGASKQTAAGKGEQQPRAREAARENALIEHPSIYIARSSKSILMEKATSAASSPKSNIVIKKAVAKESEPASQSTIVNKLEDAAWQSDDDDAEAFDDDQFICSKPLSRTVKDKQVQAGTAKLAGTAEVKPKNIKRTKSGGAKRVSSSSSIVQTEKIKVQAVNVKPIEKRAWKNKFIVDDWDLDEQENVDSDFDSMFEPVKKRKTKAKRQQQQLQRSKKAQRVSNDLGLDLTTDSEDLSQETLEIVIEGGRVDSENTVELISIRSLSMENSIENANDEINLFAGAEAVADAQKEEAPKKVEKRRQPTQVRRIEPERRPGWQLKKQRSKRRPLVNSNVDNKQQSTGVKSSKRCSSSSSQSSVAGSKSVSPTTNANSSSKSSAPTFIDRIGSSIVANLTNLTNGLVSSGALNTCTPVGHSSPLVEGSEKMQQQAVASKVNMQATVASLGARKQLSRNSLKRQSVTAVQANMQRRPDRRLKMFAHPNGCSVNRKVHASIH